VGGATRNGLRGRRSVSCRHGELLAECPEDVRVQGERALALGDDALLLQVVHRDRVQQFAVTPLEVVIKRSIILILLLNLSASVSDIVPGTSNDILPLASVITFILLVKMIL
jgi:hypothetical protein